MELFDLKIETALHVAVDKGFDREVLTFTPKLTRGFPAWQAWLDEPETITSQRENALKSALETLVALGNEAQRELARLHTLSLPLSDS